MVYKYVITCNTVVGCFVINYHEIIVQIFIKPNEINGCLNVRKVSIYNKMNVFPIQEKELIDKNKPILWISFRFDHVVYTRNQICHII